MYLAFIKYIGKEFSGQDDIPAYSYELFFTDSPETFWGDDFTVRPAGIVNGMEPYPNSYNEVRRYTLNVKLDLAIENMSFTFQDCIDGILALAWENIDGYEEYPSEGRLILRFGEAEESVLEKLKR